MLELVFRAIEVQHKGRCLEMYKILIIDDQKEYGNMLKDYFEGNADDYEVIAENDARQAFDTARKYRPDLILLDIIMPKKDGFEVMKLLKKDQKTSFIPIIIMTVVDTEQSRIEASRNYAEDYVIKPVSLVDLKKKVEQVRKRCFNHINSKTYPTIL